MKNNRPQSHREYAKNVNEAKEELVREILKAFRIEEFLQWLNGKITRRK